MGLKQSNPSNPESTIQPQAIASQEGGQGFARPRLKLQTHSTVSYQFKIEWFSN
jgi:hypothetical protein